MPERSIMIEKTEYNPTTHTGVDAVDCKAIHGAIQRGEKLDIDRYGHICDSSHRWIADGKERERHECTLYGD